MEEKAEGLAMLGHHTVRPRVRVGGPSALALACAILVLAGGACRQGPENGAGVRAYPITSGELPLVVTRLPRETRRYLAREGDLSVRIAVDPALVELRRVRRYSLWRLDDEEGWVREGTTEEGENTLPFRPTEGVHGLCASVVYEDGEEALVPHPGDPPVVYLYTDGTPPVVRWSETAGVALAAGASGAGPGVSLAWQVDDARLGKQPLVLEWSDDGGEAWTAIAELPAAEGTQRYRWRLPAELVERTDLEGVLVRARVSDAVGQSGAAVLALEGAPSGEGRGAEGATSDGDDLGDGERALAAGEPAADSPEAGPGEPPPEREESQADAGGVAAPVAPVELELPEGPCVRAGASVTIAWSVREESTEAPLEEGSPVRLELALEDAAAGGEDADGEGEGEGEGWITVGEAQLGDAAIEWTAPSEDGAVGRLRLRIERPEGELVVLYGAALRVDASPPVVEPVELPARLPADPRLPLSVRDDGCAPLARVRTYLRGDGETFWNELSEERATLAAEHLSLDLRSLAEGSYQLYLAAIDSLGNEAPAPGPASESLGSFVLDRTPPHIAVEPPVVPWVTGFEGEVVVALDAADCTPPIVVDGREPGGEWQQIKELESLALPGNSVTFPVPVATTEYQVRISVRDTAGNAGVAVVDPRAVEPSIRLQGYEEGTRLLEESRERISWTLHTAARQYSDELEVSVAHQPRKGASWVLLKEGLPAEAVYYWDVPRADDLAGASRRAQEGENGEVVDEAGSSVGPAVAGVDRSPAEHRLRVRLHRRGEVVGEDVSAAFHLLSMRGEDEEAAPVRIAAASLRAVDEAGVALARFREALEAEAATDEELSGLAVEARARYERALALDARNHHATFGLAQLLELADPEGQRAEVVRWLEATIAIVPDHAMALNDLGAIHLRSGEYARAEELLERSVRARATDRAHFNLGLALLYQGKTAEARRSFEKALALEGDDSSLAGDVQFYMIHSYLLDGREDVARRLWEETRDEIDESLRANLEERLGSGSS